MSHGSTASGGFMRSFSTLLFMAFLTVVSMPASAGTLTFSEGKPQWQSTECAEPAMPASLIAMDKETRASGMNSLMEGYNQYAAKMQDYMNCVSKEAETDSDTASQTIAKSAGNTIETAQHKVGALQETLQAKQ
jgi:hypothetical protein